jgi:hypothetical protein
VPDQLLPQLPPLHEQVGRLRGLGLDVADDSAAHRLPHLHDALVAVRHDALPAADLVARWTLRGRDGFVVADMVDLDEFVPTPEPAVPDSPLYLVTGLDRGDGLRSCPPRRRSARLGA